MEHAGRYRPPPRAGVGGGPHASLRCTPDGAIAASCSSVVPKAGFETREDPGGRGEAGTPGTSNIFDGMTEVELSAMLGHDCEIHPADPSPSPEASATCSCGWAGEVQPSVRAAELSWLGHLDEDDGDEDDTPAPTAADIGELAGQLRRDVAAFARADPVAAVRLLARIGAWAAQASADAVTAAREAGASWPQIGEAAGVSKQTAHARWAPRPR